MVWTANNIALAEEKEIFEKIEDGELFKQLNLNIKNIKMKNNDHVYIDLYEGEQESLKSEEEDKEKDITIWLNVNNF